MIDIDARSITAAVLAAQAGGTNARLQEVMTGLVRHLHDFAREVRLTEAEWGTAIRFLTEVGHITDERRQEFILLSDTLGLSTLVTAQNNVKPAGCTEATVFGPFFVEGAPDFPNGTDIANGAAGQPCHVSGRILAHDGRAIPYARIAVWQSDEEGFYDVQKPGLHQHQARGRIRADAEGRFAFWSILAAPYPIPHDGPVGRMLEALGRHPWRPAHLHFMVQAPGFETLVTQVFRSGGDYLDSDAVFGVRSSLLADWVLHAAGTAPDGKDMDCAYATLKFDFVLDAARKARAP